MAGEGKGWISLHRSIQEHWIWQDPQKLKWWLDILLLANHKDNKFLLGNELMKLERGEHHTSEVKLSERWEVDRKTVRRFLKLLESDGMIELKKTPQGTTIKVNNYNDYQDISEDKGTTEGTTKSQPRGQQSPSERDTNNNDNNVNNDNKYINNNITPIEVYQNNIFPTPGAIEIQGINNWSNDLGNELVIYAIEIAAKNNARSWKYIEHTLMDWNDNNIKTLDQVKAYSQHRKRKGGEKQNGGDRKYNSENKGEYNFNRPYEGPSHDGKIDF